MRRLLVCAVLFGCAGRVASPASGAIEAAELERLRGAPTSCDGASSAWAERVGHEGARVVHPARLADDGRRITALLARVDARIEQYLRAPTSLAGARVHLVADPRSPVQPGSAVTYSARGEAGSVAEVFLPAPSCVPAGLRNGLGLPMDLGYAERTLVHEMAGPALHERTSAKTRGWRFYDAPSWFVQGLEEWVALSTEPEGATAQLQAARAAARDVDARVAVRGGAIVVADPYVDGRMLVAFLHAALGVGGVLRLLDAEADTFDAALAEALGAGPDLFVAHYREWMKAP